MTVPISVRGTSSLALSVKRWLLPVHRWVGMTAGLVLAWIALTGSGLIFRDQLTPVIDPQLQHVPICATPLPVDALAAIAREAYPDVALAHYWLRPHSPRSAQLRFADNETVFIDPCSGRVLGQQHKYRGVFGVLENWHRLKFLPAGSSVAGSIVLLAALVLLIGGAVLWWATRRPAVASTPVPSRAAGSRPGIRNHRRVGIWVFAVVLVSALTGLPKSFGWYQQAILQAGGSLPELPAPRSSLTRADEPRIALQQAWQHAMDYAPQLREARLYLPIKPDAPVEIELLEANAPHAEALTRLYVDAYSGHIIEARPYASGSPGSKLLAWMLALHKGRLGQVGQIALLGVLSIPWLAYTGLGSYLRRRSLRQTRRNAAS